MGNIGQIATGSIAISWVDLLASLGLSVVLGLMIALVYRLTHRSLNYERSFLTTLVLTPPLIALIMMLIGSNLALSLGMVGSLSIIRFRTVIKDSRDMVFLLFVIAVGLGCGTYNWVVSVIASVFMCVIIYILYRFKYGKRVHSDYVLIVSGAGGVEHGRIKDALNKFATLVELRSAEHDSDGWELAFELKFRVEDEGREDAVTAELKSAFPEIRKISLLAPQLSLPL